MHLKAQTLGRLTPAQERVLACITSHICADGMPPTHEEIRQELGLRSAHGVRQHLRLIRNKGHIDILPGKSRGIRLLRRAAEAEPRGIRHIPVVGHIAAGNPILAEENLEGRVAVSEDMFRQGVLFGLRVRGDSMVNVGIRSGDLAIIRQQGAVGNGEIAAVLVGDEATLKRVYVYRGYIRLKAENDSVPDMQIGGDAGTQVRMLGLYVGLIRQTR